MEYKPERGNIVADALIRKVELVAITITHCDIYDAIKDGVKQNLEAKKLMEWAT